MYDLGVEILSDDELLDELEAERQKYTACDDDRLATISALLIIRGVYPPETIRGGRILDMVENYGARWYLWREPLNCPHCGSDQRDHKSGPPFARTIAVIINDRAHHYKCPDCGENFPLDSKTKSLTSGTFKMLA